MSTEQLPHFGGARKSSAEMQAGAKGYTESCGDSAPVIKSKFAFSKLKFEGFDTAEKDTYYVLRKSRDDEANRMYAEMLEEEDDGLYIRDIMRGGIKNDDPRIPRNISE